MTPSGWHDDAKNRDAGHDDGSAPRDDDEPDIGGMDTSLS